MSSVKMHYSVSIPFILAALLAVFLMFGIGNTALADIVATYSAGDQDTLHYYDSNYNEVTDPTQVLAYQYAHGNTDMSQSQILDLIQSGGLKVENTPTYDAETGAQTGSQTVLITTFKGSSVDPSGYASTPEATQLFGPNNTELVVQSIKTAATGHGISDSQILVAAQQQLQANQQKFGSGYTESSNEVDTASDIMVRLGLPDPRSVPGGQEARQEAIQAAEARWRATQEDDGGFFGGILGFAKDLFDLAVCTTQDTIHAVGLRENGCGGGGGGGYSTTACSPGTTGTYPICIPTSQCPPGTTGTYPHCVDTYAPPSCPAGTTGTYPDCHTGDPGPQSCSYNGSISWGSGCSGSYSGTVQSGDSVTVTNDASCRSGSATYTCSNGSWNTTGTPTCQASFLPLSCLVSTATWSSWSACSGACGGGSGTQTRSCSSGRSSDCSGSGSRTCTNNTACTNGTNNTNNGGTGPGGTGPGNINTQTKSCTPDTLCSGGDVVARDSSCNEQFVESCDYGCSGGQCDPPPAISFGSFNASNFSGSFTASGHLQVRPVLVRQGDPTYLYWNVQNARSCAVAGTNGDSWNTSSSGAAGKTSGPIHGETTYTLRCTALPGATPPSITESFTVNITPYFEEK